MAEFGEIPESVISKTSTPTSAPAEGNVKKQTAPGWGEDAKARLRGQVGEERYRQMVEKFKRPTESAVGPTTPSLPETRFSATAPRQAESVPKISPRIVGGQRIPVRWGNAPGPTGTPKKPGS